MMRFSARARRMMASAVCVPLIVAGAACGNPAAPATQIDTFNGTLTPPVNGQITSASQSFTMKTGTVTVTLVNLSPLSTITVGVALGTINGSTCSDFEDNQASKAGNVVIQDYLPSGKYCVAIFDVGNITENVTFGITVEYPK